MDGDHDNFTSAMTSSVMGVQILVSVVMMLLLLLSGDVETNPGPSEYNLNGYLHACTSMCILNNVNCDIGSEKRVYFAPFIKSRY